MTALMQYATFLEFHFYCLMKPKHLFFVNCVESHQDVRTKSTIFALKIARFRLVIIIWDPQYFVKIRGFWNSGINFSSLHSHPILFTRLSILKDLGCYAHLHASLVEAGSLSLLLVFL